MVPWFAAGLPPPTHCALLLRSRACPHIHLQALATVLLTLWRRCALTPVSTSCLNWIRISPYWLVFSNK
jgi:hypothetical protein